MSEDRCHPLERAGLARPRPGGALLSSLRPASDVVAKMPGLRWAAGPGHYAVARLSLIEEAVVSASRPSRRRARLAATALFVGVAALGTVSACSAGQVAQTADEVAAVPGANADINGPGGAAALRDMVVVYNGPRELCTGRRRPDGHPHREQRHHEADADRRFRRRRRAERHAGRRARRPPRRSRRCRRSPRPARRSARQARPVPPVRSARPAPLVRPDPRRRAPRPPARPATPTSASTSTPRRTSSWFPAKARSSSSTTSARR